MIEISIIIPSYQPDKYIYECIQSLINQSLSEEKYEIILVLNGCNEPYNSQINKFIRSLQPQINILFIQTNIKGVSNARNIGLEHANGKYICFIDDDDIVSHNYLEELLKNSSEDSITVSNVYSFKYDNKIIEDDYLTMNNRHSHGIINDRKYLSNACCKLIPINIIGTRRFDAKFPNGEDALFMFNLSNKIKKINKTSKNCIYYRRLRKGSASRKKISLQYRIKRIIKQQIAYTQIILNKPTQYNWILYLTRLLAVLKQ